MDSGASALKQQLELTDGGTTDVEAGPAHGQENWGNHQEQPKVHDREEKHFPGS